MREEYWRLLKERAEKLARESSVGAALADLTEAAAIMPEKQAELASLIERCRREGLWASARAAGTLEQLELIADQLAGEDGRLGAEDCRELASAYGGMCSSLLQRHDFSAALACLSKASERGINLLDRAGVRDAIFRCIPKLNAGQARRFGAVLAEIDKAFLRNEGRSLLKVQIAAIQTVLRQGKSEDVREWIEELLEQFGAVPELAALKAQAEVVCDLSPEGMAAQEPEESSPGVEELSRWFPVQPGRWWEYTDGGKGRELWRVASVEKRGADRVVHFEGQARQGSESSDLRKVVYLTENGVYADAPDPSSGGRVLLWSGTKRRVEIQGPNKREVEILDRNAEVTAGGRTFTGCICVRVRSSLIDPGTGEARFSVLSWYWYAPGVGLVKVKTDAGTTWELVSWGMSKEGKEPLSGLSAAKYSVNGSELLKQRPEDLKREGVGTVAPGSFRIGVDFEKESVDTDAGGGSGQGRDELSLTP